MTIQSEIQALNCADCARSDSAVTDLKPDSTAADPGRCADGLERGAPGSATGVTRRKLLRNGVLGFAAVYGATQLSFEDGLGVGGRRRRAEPMQQSIVVDLPERRQRRPQLLRADERTGVRASTSRSRPTIARVHRRPARAPTVGTTIMPGTGGTLGVRQQARVRHRRRPNGDTKGFDTLYGDGTGGAGLRSRDLPGGRLQPAQPLALREPRLLVRRCARAAADRLARTLARPLRLADEPAAGGLARLQPVQADPLGEGARVRARGPPGRRLRRARRHGRRRTARSASWPPCRPRPGNDRARPLARHDGPHGRRRRPPDELLDGGAPARGLPAQQRPLAEAAARGDAALGGPRHAHRHDRLGQLRHARRPDRGTGSAARDALARAGRVQGRPDRARRRAAA